MHEVNDEYEPVPIKPNPPAFDTAIAISAMPGMAIGAIIIGVLISRTIYHRSQIIHLGQIYILRSLVNLVVIVFISASFLVVVSCR